MWEGPGRSSYFQKVGHGGKAASLAGVPLTDLAAVGPEQRTVLCHPVIHPKASTAAPATSAGPYQAFSRTAHLGLGNSAVLISLLQGTVCSPGSHRPARDLSPRRWGPCQKVALTPGTCLELLPHGLDLILTSLGKEIYGERTLLRSSGNLAGDFLQTRRGLFCFSPHQTDRVSLLFGACSGTSSCRPG